MSHAQQGADHKPETALYVVDESLRIVSCNSALRAIYPALQVGRPCHEQLCGEPAQCPNCPLRAPAEQDTMFFNPLLRRWVIAHWTDMDWPGTPGAKVLMARAGDDNRAFLSDLARLHSYDEVLELDLAADTYATVYRSPSSTSLRPLRGTLSALIRSESEGTIHPADVDAFDAFWNLGDLSRRISDAGNCASESFHEIRSDGAWHLVRRVVSAFRSGSGGRPSVFCFTTLLSALGSIPSLLPPDERDPLTGLFRGKTFLSKGAEFLDSADPPLCIAAVDIEHFKLFNKWFGRDTGDRLLRSVAESLSVFCGEVRAAAGYMGNDNFAVILPDFSESISLLMDRVTETVRGFGDSAGFLPIFGICPMQGGLDLNGAYDRAVLALSTIKGQYTVRMSRFRSTMLEDMEGEQALISDVQDALRNNRITFFVQPLCRIATGRVVGGEVLMRWKRNDGSFMPPGQFIPILERNGFITNVDRYVWEEACRWLRRLIDSGIRPVPISLNVSRIDVYSLDVAEYFRNLAVKYSLDPALIKVEITESAYMKAEEADSTGRLSTTTEALRNAGFMVLLDDFGSGYSSLSMMESLNVDILKIDMLFLNIQQKAPRKGTWLISSVLDMANASELPVIMEGVETEEQAKLLENLGCLYAQGYHFHRPMPREAFAALIANDLNVDRSGLRTEAAEPLRGSEIFHEQALPDSVLNDILGAVALIEVDGNQALLQRCNRHWVQLTGISPENDVRDCLKLLQRIHEEDRPLLLERHARSADRIPEIEEYEIRYFAPDEQYHWYIIRAYYLGLRNGHITYCLSCRNNTERHMQESRLRAASSALTSLISNTSPGLGHYRTAEEKKTGESLLHQMTAGGTVSVRCDEELSVYSVSDAFASMLGYASADEFMEATGGGIAAILHPQDRRRVFGKIGPSFTPGFEYCANGRVRRKDGSYMWALNRGRIHLDGHGRPIIVSAVIDLTEAMRQQADLADRSELALSLSQEMKFLSAGMPGGYHRTTSAAGYEFLHVSETFMRMTGYDRRDIKELFDNKLLNMIHPDDRESVQDALAGPNESMPALEFRLRTRTGWIWVIDQFTLTAFEGHASLQGIALEISETVNLRSRMELLIKHSPDRVSILETDGREVREELLINGLFHEDGSDRSEKKYSGLLPEDAELYRKEILAASEDGRDLRMTLRAESSAGRQAWISITARFMSASRGGARFLVIMRDVTPEVRSIRETASEREKLNATLRLAGISSWDWNIEERTLTLIHRSGGSRRKMSRAVMTHFPDRLLRHGYIPRSFHPTFLNLLRDISESGGTGPKRFEVPLQIPDGRLYWVQIDYEALRDESGNVFRAIGAYTDITAKKKSEAQAQEERSILRLLQSAAVYDFKADILHDTARIGKGSAEWMQRTGYSCDTYSGTVMFAADNIVAPEFRNAFLTFTDRHRLAGIFRSGTRQQSMEYISMIRGEPSWRRISIHMSDTDDGEGIAAYIFIVSIDSQKQRELQLATMAEKDPLTELYNRRRAIPEIESLLSSHSGEPAALIMFDIDDLKQINDTMGHPAGDRSIRLAADLLRANFRRDDIICRMGGDEFLVFCRGIPGDMLDRKLRSIIDGMAETSALNDLSVTLTAGYAVHPADGAMFAELYGKADLALYRAKGCGKNTFFAYDASMSQGPA